MFDGLIDGYTQSLLIFAGINVIAAYSFFAPFKTGQVSLGQAGFMAVGAYASAILTQKFGLPFAVALPFGGADRRRDRRRRRLSGAAHQGHLSAAADARLLRNRLGDRAELGICRRRAGLTATSHSTRARWNTSSLIVVLLILFFAPARAFQPRPRDGFDPSGRDRGRGHGHRRGAHQAAGLRHRRRRSQASPARSTRITRPTWTPPPSTSCCRSKS